MYRLSLIVVVVLCSFVSAKAQNEIGYEYDLRGNRVLKNPTGNKKGDKLRDANTDGLAVYPNPARSIVYLSLSAENVDSLSNQCSVYDMQGRQVLRQRILLGSGPHPFNVSTLSPGEYYISVSRDDETVSTIPFIISK